MSPDYLKLPKVGEAAPPFEVRTQKGLVRFPEFSAGRWCIFFAHPANFTSAWRMYSDYLELKERWLNERNTKLLVLSNETIRHNDWSDIVRRYIGIFLKAPVIEDPDFRIATLYGMASGRRLHAPFDRILYIIDPDGIIRLILHRPLASIQNAITDLEKELTRLQSNPASGEPVNPSPPLELQETIEQPDAIEGYKPRPAYFRNSGIILN